MRHGIPAALLLIAISAVAAEAPVAGSWTGSWVRAGDALPVTFHFRHDATGWSGSFDSDQLRVVGVPLRNVRVSLPAVEWSIVGDVSTTTFRGELRGETLSGTFDEPNAHGTFSLRRESPERRQPREQEVTFRNGDVVLAGSVLMPESARSRLPGVVFLHGSGAEGRWASKYLATRFADAGFAALVFDKRGVGKSTGNWRTATIDDLVADAVAAIEALRKLPEVDPVRVGVHGHSQGGTLAPLVAVKAGQVAFIIASAAAGVSPEQAEIYSVENSVGLSSLAPSEADLARDYIRTFVTTAYRNAPHQHLLELWQQFKGKPWALEPPPEGSYYWTFSPQFAQYEPLRYWREVRSPVLLVYGADDKRVPARPSAAAISSALIDSGAESLSIRIFPSADHTLRVPSKGAWPATPAGYPQVLTDWASRVLR